MWEMNGILVLTDWLIAYLFSAVVLGDRSTANIRRRNNKRETLPCDDPDGPPRNAKIPPVAVTIPNISIAYT
jgi:hypothetical protein